jgi:hypothetical protein
MKPKVSGFALLDRAKRFLEAAQYMSAPMWSHNRPLRWASVLIPEFLLGRAVELTLKSHLAHKGADEATLRNIGHDLITALVLSDAEIRALLNDEETNALRHLSYYYADKFLEYPLAGTKTRGYSMPPPDVLIKATARLIRHLNPLVKEEVAERMRASRRSVRRS